MSFFERLGGLAKNIGDKTSEAIEVSKLNARIGTEKTAIEDCLHQIGTYFYQRYQAGELSASGADDLFRAIDSHKQTIAEIEAEIEKLKAEPAASTDAAPEPAAAAAVPATDGIACPACATVNAVGTKFCSECGSKLETPPEPAATLCPGCGAPIVADAKFCGECGHRFG